MTNTAVWFDMPVQNLDRAPPLLLRRAGRQVREAGILRDGLRPLPALSTRKAASLAAWCRARRSNAPDPEGGLLLYFNCEGRLDDAIKLVEPNGGKVVQPKHQIGPHGFRAVVHDSEGNRVALHSR